MLSGLTHAEQVKRLIAGGAEIIQLREKRMSPRQFYEASVEAVGLAKRHNIPVIINDRVDIALVTGAAGVHLGQDDMPPAAARKVLGSKAMIGYSTHTVEQAVAAASMPVDYIALGPIFPTSGKGDAEDVVGPDTITEVRERIGEIPIVAIGGINAENFTKVFSSGADSAAIISALVSDAALIEARMRAFAASTV